VTTFEPRPSIGFFLVRGVFPRKEFRSPKLSRV
jgi:hypothetical protein